MAAAKLDGGVRETEARESTTARGRREDGKGETKSGMGERQGGQ